MSDGERPGGSPRPGPRPPDPRPPSVPPVETRQERRARLARSPLITEAPPLTEWQRDRLAVLLAPVRRLVSA
jgi:hypothetical protein